MCRGSLIPKQKFFSSCWKRTKFMSFRRCGGKLFHTRRPAALKFRSPKLSCVRGTKHVLMAAERCGRCRQLGMPVSDPLVTGAPDMQPCSQLVDEQEASAIDAAPARCHIDESQCPDVRRRSGSNGSFKKCWMTYRTTRSCSSRDGGKRTPGPLFWRRRWLYDTGLLPSCAVKLDTHSLTLLRRFLRPTGVELVRYGRFEPQSTFIVDCNHWRF